MDVIHRARIALDRGEPGRALKLLVGRLRKVVDDEEALDLLGYIYVQHLGQPGMEGELIRGVERRPDAEAWLGWVVEELEEAHKEAMAKALREEAQEKGYGPLKTRVEDCTPVPEVEEQSGRSGAAQSDGSAVKSSSSAGENIGRTGESNRPETPPGKERQGEPGLEAEGKEESHGRSRRWITTLLGSAAAMVAVVVVGALIWQQVQSHHRLRIADEAVLALDPMDAEAALGELTEVGSPLGGADLIADRKRFVRALVAMDQGRELEGAIGEAETGWARAARAMELATRQQWEGAMADVHYLQRAQRDTLPALMARGRICEARGQWRCAQEMYAFLQEHFPDFVGAHQGMIRVGAYRYERQWWEEGQRRLRAVNGDHIYAGLEWIEPLSKAGGDGAQEVGEEDRVSGDEFVEVWQTLGEGLAMRRASEFDEVLGLCRGEHDEVARRLATVHVLCAMGAAGRLEADVVEFRLRRALRLGEESQDLVAAIQREAPHWLSDLGRSREGLAFSVPVDDEGEVIADEQKGFEEDKLGWNQRVLARARVLNGLGRSEEVRQILGQIEDSSGVSEEVALQRVKSFINEGDREAAREEVSQVEDSAFRRGLEGLVAYYEGGYQDSYEAFGGRAEWPVELIRARALALLSDGRRRQALAVVSQAGRHLDTLLLASVRQRVLARGDKRDGAEDGVELDGEESEKWSTIDVLIDRGAKAFWQRDLEGAAKLIDRVLEQAPHHPEAVWKGRLIDRMEGAGHQRRYSYQQGWRGDEDSMELMLESGRVHLDFGRYAEARRTFLDAMYRDRQELEAIRGLAKAYKGYDRQRGLRDLRGLMDNYSSSASDQPGRAELLRWIAVLEGLREGDEEALETLEEALELAGERPVLLKEKGRHYKAREEWDDAREAYGRALQMEPTSAETYLGLARTAYAQEEMEEARDYLRQLWRLSPVGEVRHGAEMLEEQMGEER